MEQDTTFRRSICPCPKEFVGSSHREHDRRRRDDQDSQSCDVRPGRGRDSIQPKSARKLDADLQTSTTYGFTKIANYIEDSVKTYDLRNEEEEETNPVRFSRVSSYDDVDNFIFEEHAFKTTKNFDNLFFPKKAELMRLTCSRTTRHVRASR
jgi:hypothetical protein